MVKVSFFLQKAAKAAESLLSGAATRKRLDVAIVGAPNAGKSQLLNVLTGSSIAAVSRKRHTTRTDILGARTVGDTQIVFKDTPGYLRLDDAKEERLNRELIVNAASEMQNVDYTLLVVDAARTMSSNYQHALVQLMLFALKSNGRVEEGFTEEEQKSESPNEEQRPKFAVVLNKVDLVKPKSKLLDLAMEIGTMADACLLDHLKANMETDEDHQDENAIELDIDTMMDLAPITFYTSALANEGVDDVVDHLIELATPCKNWAVPAGQATDMSSEEQTQELIREKIYRCLHKEVPHSVAQVNRMFKRVPQGVIIHQDLVVFTKSHQRLVLGKNGRNLQRIQETAARDLKKIFDSEVVLQLHVKLSKSKQRRSAEDFE